MIEPLTGGFRGNFVIFAQESRQFELPRPKVDANRGVLPTMEGRWALH